jgi:hypothetical protein
LLPSALRNWAFEQQERSRPRRDSGSSTFHAGDESRTDSWTSTTSRRR